MDTAPHRKITLLEQPLALPRPPIGLALVKEPPAGVGRPDGSIPSSCSFWRMAEREVFYAPEEDHFNCPIGVMTMGFQIQAHRQEEAEAAGCATWTSHGMSAFGRLTCAAIPVALLSGNASVSMGCIGFRGYTGFPDEELMIAVPKLELQTLVDRLDTIISASSALEEFHTQRRAKL